jgi:integrase
MASLRRTKGKFHTIRGRRADGSPFESVTDIPQEPLGLAPGDPEYAEAKAELEKQALEEANDVEARSRKRKMSEEEYEARARYRAKKVLREDNKASPAAFIIAWLWEHVIRNRLHYTKVRCLCNLIDGLIAILDKEGCETIHEVRREHFDSYVFELRSASYSPGVVNSAVDYLKALGREIRHQTGSVVADGLQKEQTDYDERLPFAFEEMIRIFAALPEVVGSLFREWTLFLLIMLYTEMRPADSARTKRKDIRLEDGAIRITSSKTKGFRSKHKWKPMHKRLLRYVTQMLAEVELQPEDLLCQHLGHMSEQSLSTKFRDILDHARIDQLRNKGENRINPFSQKSLYSIKHTACVWYDATGGKKQDQKDEHCDSTEQAKEHYRHDTPDPTVMEMRRQTINRMPDVGVEWKKAEAGVGKVKNPA